MATSDTVVGIVGAVVLTAAMVAVFYYENANVDDRPAGSIGEGENSYVFTYEKAKSVVLDAQAQPLTGAGATATHSFALPPYVWAVNVTVTWTETGEASQLGGTLVASGPDQFSLVVEKETGDPMPENPDDNRDGTLKMEHVHPGGSSNLTSKPPALEITVYADTQAQAESTLTNETTGAGKHGVGTWNATVTLVDLGTRAAPPASQTDTGNEYAIKVEIEYWQAVVKTDDAADAPAAAVMADLQALRDLVVRIF